MLAAAPVLLVVFVDLTDGGGGEKSRFIYSFIKCFDDHTLCEILQMKESEKTGGLELCVSFIHP